MADKTGIEWTDATWNPTTGCDQVSPGCDHCYALTMAKRLKAMGSAHYQRDGDPATSGPGFGLTMHPDSLWQPMRWKRPRRIFVNSMSDLFHQDVTDDFLVEVFHVMRMAEQHTFQVLTKRHARMRSLLSSEAFRERVFARGGVDTARRPDLPHFRTWPTPNVWLGVSVEDQKWADIRVPALLDTPAAVRFLSCEPLLGPVDLSRWLGVEWMDALDGYGHEMFASLNGRVGTASGLHWVIVGGESGRGSRPMSADWAREIRDQCAAAGVPFLFKQWGSHDEHGAPMGKHDAGRTLDGRTWDEYPTAATP